MRIVSKPSLGRRRRCKNAASGGRTGSLFYLKLLACPTRCDEDGPIYAPLGECRAHRTESGGGETVWLPPWPLGHRGSLFVVL